MMRIDAMNHAPLPYIAECDPCHYDTLSSITSGDMRIEVGGNISVEEQEGTTRFVVKACNNYYMLVESLETIARGDYDNAHDPKAAAKVAKIALEAIKG